MNTHSAISVLSLLCVLTLPLRSEEARDFTSKEGKKLTGEMKSKTGESITVKLDTGREVVIRIENLSDQDKEWVASWDPLKARFANEFRMMSLREMLEARGYESADFRLEGNHILVDGELNKNKARFLIDTGAGTTVLHLAAAKEKGCEVGPLDHRVYGIAGESKAATTKIPVLTLGESTIPDLEFLSTDLFPAGNKPTYDGILGTDFMSELNAIIDYREMRIFLKPPAAPGKASQDAKDPGGPITREFTKNDKKTIRGTLKTKTESSVTIKLESGKEVIVRITDLVEKDQKFVNKWEPLHEKFRNEFGKLTTSDLLDLRKYKAFKFEHKNNHIYVNGLLNGKEMRFLIDTGAFASVLHLASAKNADCEIGPMNQKVFGVGGESLAAATLVKSITIGDAVVENRKILAFDLTIGGKAPDFDAIFGADLLRELDGVVDYAQGKIFLKPEQKAVKETSTKPNPK